MRRVMDIAIDFALVSSLAAIAVCVVAYPPRDASVDTLPKGGDAQQAPCVSKGSAVPQADAPEQSA